MMSKNTIANVAVDLAGELALRYAAKLDDGFLKRCEELDEKILKIADDSFDGEKISKERKQRILDKFSAGIGCNKRSEETL